mmetsp:Transcript_8909/g.26963  ORF Transcript_8909/g.26963 Transcript_8909/m.26963 type:complete len:208 (+) Transcript_8909:347-970(+)
MRRSWSPPITTTTTTATETRRAQVCCLPGGSACDLVTPCTCFALWPPIPRAWRAGTRPPRTPSCSCTSSLTGTPSRCRRTGRRSGSTLAASAGSRSHRSSCRNLSARRGSKECGKPAPLTTGTTPRRSSSPRRGRRSTRRWARSTSTTRSCTTRSSSTRPSPGCAGSARCTTRARSSSPTKAGRSFGPGSCPRRPGRRLAWWVLART